MYQSQRIAQRSEPLWWTSCQIDNFLRIDKKNNKNIVCKYIWKNCDVVACELKLKLYFSTKTIVRIIHFFSLYLPLKNNDIFTRGGSDDNSCFSAFNDHFLTIPNYKTNCNYKKIPLLNYVDVFS